MRVLVTGGCGFIGSHLVEYHLNKGDQVHAIDNLSTGSIHNIEEFKTNPSFRFDEADLLTWRDLEKATASADRIYHFAAAVGVFNVISNPMNVVSSNIIATRRLFQAVADNNTKPMIILASSSSVYGDSPKHQLREDDDLIVKPPAHPLATYAISKIADESIALAYNRTAHLPIIIVRLFNTIGLRQTGQYGMVVPRFVGQACRHEPFTIFGNGNQTRSFCDVRDVVVALDLLANTPKAIGEMINVGNDSEITINDLAALVSQCAGTANISQYIPYEEAYEKGYTDIIQRRPDLSKLLQLTEFKHKWTLADTIHQLISNYQYNNIV